MTWLHILGVSLLVLAALALLFKRLLTPTPIPGIPHNYVGRKVPLGGDGPEMGQIVPGGTLGDHQVWFDELYRRHGGICQSLLPFGLTFIVLSDPVAIHDVLWSKTGAGKPFDVDKKLVAPALGPVLRTGMVSTPSGEQHRNHRRAAAPALSRSYLARYVPRMTRIAEDLIQLWTIKAKRAEGRPFEARLDALCASTDINGAILFNHDFGETRSAADLMKHLEGSACRVNARGAIDELPYRGSELFKAVNLLVSRIGEALTCGFPRIYHFFDTFKRDRRRAERLVRGYLKEQMLDAREVVRSRAASGHVEIEEGASVAQMFAEKADSSDGRKLSMDEVRTFADLPELHLRSAQVVDELLTMTAAGAETVASSLQWGLKLLQQNPEAQYRLHDYLVQHWRTLEERLPTLEDLERVPLLDATVYELLRLSTGGNVRTVMQPVEVMGHHLPVGAVVYLNRSAQHLESRPDGALDEAHARKERGFGYWTDPQRFDPTRWLDADGQFDMHAGPNFMFSHGPRACWGKTIAMLELKVVFAMISMSFFLDSVPAELDSMDGIHNIGILPKECFIRPVKWSEVVRKQ